MSLIEKLEKDKLQAMKNKDSVKKSILSIAISDAVQASKREASGPVSDEQVFSALKKIRKGSEENFERSKEQIYANEMAIIDQYLPRQMSETELREVISNFLKTLPEDQKVIGSIMKYLTTNYKGLYDGRLASSIAKELL